MASKRIVMFPYLAQGHIIPFLALAKLVEQRNPSYTITIVSTPLNIQNIRSSLPPNSNILLNDLPFCSSDHGLPPNTENTDSVPHHQISKLNAASGTLQPHFERFISDVIQKDGHPPLCIISDVMVAWTVGIAKKLGIFHVAFTTCGAYGTAAYMSLYLHLPHRHTDSSEIRLPGFPETFRLHRSQMPEYLRVADGTEPWATFLRRNTQFSLQSGAMICNTVEALELLGIQALRNLTGLNVLAIGPLFPLEASTSSDQRYGKKPGIQLEACLEWLDSHPPGSVVYTSFGSQSTITASQMMALARGLEASNKPFLWLVRPPAGFDLNEDFRDEWLPEGFEVRMSKNRQGLLVRKWAPQLEILSHKSTGAFLSHCGWNSSLESLSRGVPVIGWPLMADQFYNFKMLDEELGVCAELARGAEDPLEYTRVERVIRLVLDEEKGKEMKEKAIKYAEMIRAAVKEEGDEKGSSLRVLDDFIRGMEEASPGSKHRVTGPCHPNPLVLYALMASNKEIQPMVRVIAVVVVPLPAQGHLNQLLHLSRLLAARRIPVHYVGSASHNRQARERALGWPPETPAHHPIRFHDFFLPPFPSPPASTHAPLAHLLPLFDAAALHFRYPLAALLRSLTTNSRRVVLIHDSTMAFAASVAASVPHVEAFSFHSVSAFALLLFYCESRRKYPDDPSIAKLNLPHIPNNACFTQQFLDFLRRQHESTAADSGRLFNTCRGIEGRFIDLLAREPEWRNQKTFAIGPLNPVSITKMTGYGTRHPCLDWLDRQPPASVMYVSFGTTSALSDEQLLELAWGLEASRQRFIWVLRDADRADIYTEEGAEGKQKAKKRREEWLGRLDYDRRVERVGRLVEWAPQLEILAHPSTGGFMSHCGWNSCMESMSMGVPLLTWPMHSDQPRNALLVTRVLRVGITARDWARRNEVVPAAEIRDSIVRLMVSEEGKEVRVRAKAVGGVVRHATTEGGTSRADFDAFITHITQ
uniref:Uncharacterized protein LOC105043134 n=2 Tax=Elaeis guineensis var. tenera TaxID=51953 RepID=A0A6I9R364_ELAGV|nr:uncharacterized protein LOC105043134 [Elaeis guineensis]